ncbi:EAL domain-containing protein [Alicyclobacillus sp. SO9]|uniref:EAL domain-containing protein n=1 Tax=Alicyclobacillus sp. SO9 TaxID=2665646 RepID=UPI0018E8794E|nr:EAL domain-containing protein [Alicyclobacillus sp. SO9]QQE79256.1 EAL domain-containing protein [Alicyclobacillus sp. SO9]
MMFARRRSLTPCEIKMQRVTADLEEQKFQTFQQEIVQMSADPCDKRIHGIEILNRPMLGTEFSSTEEFFSFSASHGRSQELDVYTLQLGLERFAESGIAENKRNNRHVFLNVHLSTLFSEEWNRWLADFPIAPDMIVLELSEREGLDTYSKTDVESVIHTLQHTGMKIAVDDVGMGYSGLHTLAMVKPDYVKIDRQLVSHIDADPYRQHMMTSLVDYWREERVYVIAEGIERKEEAQFFSQIGTSLAQGYYFHRPEVI